MTQQISLVGGMAGDPIVKERIGVGAIIPGHLVDESLGTIAVHAAAAKNAQPLFALKNIAVAGDIDTVYLTGETVNYGAFSTGQEVLALVAAAAPAILDGDDLESAGDGTLRKVVTDAATDDTQRNSIVAIATVNVDNSGGGTAVRINVRIA